MGAYEEQYRRSLEDPEGFWLDAAAAIDWEQAPTRALDDSAAPLYRWYPDGVLNTCHNALDRHADGGRAEQLALVHDSPVTGEVRSFSYGELRDRVARVAGAMRRLGVEAGDTVVIYMPMVPEAVEAMLACARIGAVHSVVFGGFAPRELAARIDDARPVLVVSASCGIEGQRVIEYMPLLDAALEAAEHAPAHCIVLQRPQARAELTPRRDLEWAEALDGAEPAAPVPVAATDPLYVLYTSGTTVALL
jgi:propionyl-CoA synthetase